MIDPVVVDWQITSRCTRNCGFCFGPKSEPDLSHRDVRKVVNNLKNLGTRAIELTGGEPLMRPDIDEIIQYIRKLEIGLCLFTNCDLYFQHRESIIENVNVIGIPIEGPNEDIHDGLRGKESFVAVMNALKDAHSNSEAKFQICTIVSAQNYLSLESIEHILYPFEDRIVLWKLYELINYPQKGQNNKFKIRKKVFDKYCMPKLGKRLDKNKILFDTLKRRNRSYFLMKPNGDVFVPLLGLHPREFCVGNLLAEPQKTKENWNRWVSPEGYAKPYRSVFRKDLELKRQFLD
jgi:MoaA/NifB/PqqE/SkfB family radical SAM enzyme